MVSILSLTATQEMGRKKKSNKNVDSATGMRASLEASRAGGMWQRIANLVGGESHRLQGRAAIAAGCKSRKWVVAETRASLERRRANPDRKLEHYISVD